MSRKLLKDIHIRITQVELADIREKASDCGLTVSKYMRTCSLDRRTISKTDSKIINELRRLGGLQKLSLSKDETNKEEYFDLLKEINEAIRRIAASDCESTG